MQKQPTARMGGGSGDGGTTGRCSGSIPKPRVASIPEDEPLQGGIEALPTASNSATGSKDGGGSSRAAAPAAISGSGQAESKADAAAHGGDVEEGPWPAQLLARFKAPHMALAYYNDIGSGKCSTTSVAALATDSNAT